MGDKLELKDFKTVIRGQDNFEQENFINLTYDRWNELSFPQRDDIAHRTVTFQAPELCAGWIYDYSTLTLAMKMRMQLPNGNNLPDNTQIAPINYFAQTMIQNVTIFFSDTEVDNSLAYYSERACLDAWINHSNGDRWGYLESQGFFADSAADVANGVIHGDNVNEAARDRALMFANLNDDNDIVFEDGYRTFYVPLKTNFANSPTPHIPSGIPLRIVVTFHNDEHNLWAGNNVAAQLNAQLKILKCEIKMNALHMVSGMTKALEEKFDKGPLKIRSKRIEPRALSIPPQMNSLSSNFITQNSTNPERIFIVMRDSNRVLNNYRNSPNIFQAQFQSVNGGFTHLTECRVTVDGSEIYKPNADSYDAFAKLHHNQLGRVTNSFHYGNGIPWAQFCKNIYVIAFDLTRAGRAGASGNVRQPALRGNLMLHLTFQHNLANSLEVLIFQEYNCSLLINKNRTVIYNYLD